MANKGLKKDFFWNSLGSFFFGFTSLIYMIIVTRINGLDIAGNFTYAFSLAAILCSIGTYYGKTFQITETNSKYKDSDYIYSRFLTCFVMILCSIVLAFVLRFDYTKAILLILLTIYRSIDAFIECLHAILQRNNCLYKAGQSLFFKTIIFVICFYVVEKITSNVILAVLSLIVIDIIFLFAFDYFQTKKFIKWHKIDVNILKSLMYSGFNMFLYSFLSNYIINIPKYILDFIDVPSSQAIYGIIIMPASFLLMVSQYITQPFLNSMTSLIKNKYYDKLKKFMKQISLAIFGIGLCALFLTYFAGIPVLEFIYNVDLFTEKGNLIVIICGSILYSVAIFMSAVLVSMRKTKEQVIILILTGLIVIAPSYFMIVNYKITGASWSYLLMMFVQSVLYLIVLKHSLRGDKVIKDGKV